MTSDPNRRYRDLADAEHWSSHFSREGRDVWENRERLLADAAVEPGAIVMDLGAGTGAFTRLLLDRVGPEGRVHAIEVVDHFVGRLNELAAESAALRVHRSPSEVPPRSVDRILCIDTYHHLERPREVMRAARASLRADGRLLLVDLIRDEHSLEPLRSHVRATQATVEAELHEVGFVLERRLPSLAENYVLWLAGAQTSD